MICAKSRWSEDNLEDPRVSVQAPGDGSKTVQADQSEERQVEKIPPPSGSSATRMSKRSRPATSGAGEGIGIFNNKLVNARSY